MLPATSRSPAVDLHPVDVDVADAYFRIAHGLLRDPWDRLIVATATALALPLFTTTASSIGEACSVTRSLRKLGYHPAR